MLAELVHFRRAGDHPSARRGQVHVATRGDFALQRRLTHAEPFADAVLQLRLGIRGVHLEHAIAVAVHVEVEPEVEEVLMVWRPHARRHQMAKHPLIISVSRLAHCRDRSDVHHAGQLHLHVDSAVLTEYPVEQVVVVVYRGVAAQHQLTRTHRAVAVPPEHAAVAFVNGNDAWHRDRTPFGIGEHCGHERRVGRSVGTDNSAGPRGAVDRHAVVAGITGKPGDVFGIAIRRHQL